MFNRKCNFTYDSNDNLIENLVEKWQNNSWVNEVKYTYTYYPNGFSNSGMYENWINSNWVLSKCLVDLFCDENIIYNISEAKYEVRIHSNTNYINKDKIDLNSSLFPNPATNSLTLNLSQLQQLQNASLSIYDIQGKQLLQQSLTEQQTQINISSFAKGIYIVKLQTDEVTLQSKFVKE